MLRTNKGMTLNLRAHWKCIYTELTIWYQYIWDSFIVSILLFKLELAVYLIINRKHVQNER